MLFNIIIVFALIFFAAVLLMNEPTKKKDTEAKADMIVTMSWPDLSPHDVDLWIKAPDGAPIYYSHKENSYLFLDRDDLGVSNNYIVKDGEKIQLSVRREVASFRGMAPGRFVVNSMFYAAKKIDGTVEVDKSVIEPIPVVLELIQINPVYKILARKEMILTEVKEQKTAFSFIIRDGLITDIDTETEEPFAYQAAEGQ
jgi:hypothetical protein